jgi:hypothetical protein
MYFAPILSSLQIKTAERGATRQPLNAHDKKGGDADLVA